MSYQVLARKWRPQRFSDVVGQAHVLTALANGLKQNRLHHAYLFSGTRGVGKTSIARLFAKGLDCEQGVSAEPCGHCENCRAIEEGRFIDLIEIDAASRTKVEDTRDLLENVQYKPVQGRYKIYLIDEVHMLSRHSFNALLKTLEEPPEYVKFLLATTEPQKLPITILSRCMQFHLKALSQQQISDHLAFVLTQEKVPFESLALEKLAKAAQGSVRDSLSLTDQAIAMGDGEVNVSTVSDMLGLLDENQPLEIINALYQGNGEALLNAVQRIAEKGADWEQLLVDIADCLHRIAMHQLLPVSPTDTQSQIAFLAKVIAPEDVQFFYQIMLVGRKELPFAPEPRSGVEMTLLRALAFHPKYFQQTVMPENGAIPTAPVVDIPVLDNPPAQSLQQATAASKTPQQTYLPTAEQVTAKQSAGLTALEQIQKLRQQAQLQTAENNEKKNSELSPKIQSKPLPVVSYPPKVQQSAQDLLQRLSDLNSATITENQNITPSSNPSSNSTESLNEDEESDQNEAETYRWEWSNPELAIAQEQEQIRPSEIKQAIMTNPPELVQKVIELTQQRDEWAAVVGALELSRLVKQIPLNAYVITQSEALIQIGLRPEQSHLNTESAHQTLQQSLAEFYQKPIQLQIEISDDKSKLTPLELRRAIYYELTEQAKLDLQQDKKLQMLQKEFGADLDLSTVRPL